MEYGKAGFGKVMEIRVLGLQARIFLRPPSLLFVFFALKLSLGPNGHVRRELTQGFGGFAEGIEGGEGDLV